MDSSGSGSVTASQISDAIKAFESNSQTQNIASLSATSPILALLDLFANNTSSNTVGTTTIITT